jgi:serine/threonine-protein kinase
MRYMPGGSLADRLTDKPMSLKQAQPIIERIGAALEVAHNSGIVHRDLKPGNILFDQFDHPYLSDFGIAKLAAQTQTFTQGIVGTPAFMSPEQWRAKEELDGRTDQYALAIILYKMLSGDLPYKANETAGYMVAHISEPVPDILTKLPQLPANISSLLQKGLAKNRDDRFDTVSRFATAFGAIADGQRIPSTFFQTKPLISSSETEVVAGNPLVRPATMRPSGGNRSRPAPKPVPQSNAARPVARPQSPNKPSTKWIVAAVIGLLLVAFLGVGQATGMLSGILGGGQNGSNEGENGNGLSINDPTEDINLIADELTVTPTPSPQLEAVPITEEADAEPTVFATDTAVPTMTPKPTNTAAPATKTAVPLPTNTLIPTATFTPIPPTWTHTPIPPTITNTPVGPTKTPFFISPPILVVTLLPIAPTPTPKLIFPIITLQPLPIVTINPIVIPKP